MPPGQPTIELIPSNASGSAYIQTEAPPLGRKRYWQQFIYTFLVVSFIGLSFTWLRPPVYESFAILRAFYDTPDVENGSTLVHEQLVVHEQRLVSYGLIDELSNQLKATQDIDLQTSDLLKQVHAEAIPNSRLIRLTAENNDPAQLLSLINLWTELYLKQFTTDLGSSSSQEGELLKLQLQTLEGQVQSKRHELENFRQTHEILSLERDESRVLNKIHALGLAIDTATEEAATASATLNSIINAKRQGKTVVRPQDQPGLDNMESRALDLMEILKEYEQKYTPEYMALDPEIVAVKNKIDLLRRRIAERKIESQQAYLEEAEQALATANEKESSLKNQYNEFQLTAQAFSTQFEQYTQLSQETEQLELEAQKIRAELTQNEVRQPHQTRLELLEPPFFPKEHIRPHYWRDTFITLIIAFLLASLSLFFLYLTRPKRTPHYYEPFPSENQLLGHRSQGQIIYSGSHLQIAQKLPKELSHQEVTRLLQVGSKDSKILILLLLSGVQPVELIDLTWQDLDKDKQLIRLRQAPERFVNMPKELADLLDESFQQKLALPESPVFSNPDEIHALLNCTSHDANLHDSAELTPESLWHTFIADFVRRGLMLSELYKIGGHIPPEKLNQYRSLSPDGERQNLDQITPLYSLFNA